MDYFSILDPHQFCTLASHRLEARRTANKASARGLINGSKVMQWLVFVWKRWSACVESHWCTGRSDAAMIAAQGNGGNPVSRRVTCAAHLELGGLSFSCWSRTLARLGLRRRTDVSPCCWSTGWRIEGALFNGG
jgi:hypothetical protein